MRNRRNSKGLILTFRIHKQSHYQLESSSVEVFWQRDEEVSYPHAMRMGRVQKMACIKQALSTWDLLESGMHEALAYVQKLEENWL